MDADDREVNMTPLERAETLEALATYLQDKVKIKGEELKRVVLSIRGAALDLRHIHRHDMVLHELTRLKNSMEVTHKLIMPPPKEGYLNELILCWHEHGAPAPDEIRHTKYSTNINEVNCAFCWEVWVGR